MIHTMVFTDMNCYWNDQFRINDNQSFFLDRLSILIKSPRLTDRDYLKNTNNAGYKHPTKNPELQNKPISLVKFGLINQWNSQIPHFLNSHDLSVMDPWFTYTVIIKILFPKNIFNLRRAPIFSQSSQIVDIINYKWRIELMLNIRIICFSFWADQW